MPSGSRQRVEPNIHAVKRTVITAGASNGEQVTETTATQPSSTQPLPQYLDSRYWHPECKNFVVIDWARWDSLEPSPPRATTQSGEPNVFLYDPPQFKRFDGLGCFGGVATFWTHRSPYFVFPCCGLPQFLHRHCAPKRTTSLISDDGTFEAMLDPELSSAAVPDLLRGVWWLRDNVVSETLMTFQGWAWKSKRTGVVGLGTAEFNWTNDPTCLGWIFNVKDAGLFANVQIHPNGKWVALAVFRDPAPDASVSWIHCYVVQDGDVFVTPSEERLDLPAGDLVRLTWDKDDAYCCDNTKLTYMYTPRRVATMSEDGTLVKVQPAFDELRKKTTQVSEKQPLCCGHCACNMSPQERAELQIVELSNMQVWTQGPAPPPANVIDRL